MATDAETRAQFSAWLQEQLEERGWNYQQLADDVGQARSNVRNWVVGGNLPTWHSCRDLARALHAAKEEVRRRAGFVDPEDDLPTEVAAEIARLVALASAAGEEDRHMLLRIAELQSGHPRRATREPR